MKREDIDDEQGFSHHCPKCNHHNPTMCVMAGQVKGWKERADLLAEALTRAHSCATLRSDGTCDGCFVSEALTKGDAR